MIRLPIADRLRQTRLETVNSVAEIGSLAKFADRRYQEIMNSRRIFPVVGFVILLSFAGHARAENDPLLDVARKIAAETSANGQAYANLRELTTIGPRLSGSEGAAKAIDWAKRKMESYGFDHVILQPTTVPHWTRGDVEQATVTSTPKPVALKIAALGPSVGTPKEGIEANVVEVQSLDEVDQLGDAVRGKIVFYNHRMKDKGSTPFREYGRNVDQRYRGASAAARHGAVAVLVRSMTTLPDDDHPHTGMLHYEDGIAKIPAAAVSTHGANELSALLKANPKLTVNLKLSAAEHPPISSFNVIGELTGRDLPQEYVVVGGHLDSWDLATGAHDDGTGVVQAIEVVRILKALGCAAAHGAARCCSWPRSSAAWARRSTPLRPRRNTKSTSPPWSRTAAVLPPWGSASTGLMSKWPRSNAGRRISRCFTPITSKRGEAERTWRRSARWAR